MVGVSYNCVIGTNNIVVLAEWTVLSCRVSVCVNNVHNQLCISESNTTSYYY